MITIKSNIEYLTDYNKWRRGEAITSPNPKELGLNLDYAIETLKMVLDDAWDEKRADIIGQNSNEGLHYE